MALRLNKISDATIEEDIADNQERVKKFLTADASSPLRTDPVRYARRLADAALELGLELYQQERAVPEIRKYLALAGTELFGVSLQRGENAALSPLEFEKALALVACFCSPSVYARVDQIPMRKFFSDPQSSEFFATLVQYLDVLRNFLATQHLNQDQWENVDAQCLLSTASRFDAEVTRAKLTALKGVATGDSTLLNQGIGVLVEDHENEAKRGENQRSTRGFICLPALMFAHLGAARRLTCTISSAYLPLQLLSA